MKKYFIFFTVLLIFAGCEKEDDEKIGEYEDFYQNFSFTVTEWQYVEDGVEYSVLQTSKSPDYFFVVGFRGDKEVRRYFDELYEIEKLPKVLPEGFEKAKPFIYETDLVWIAFHKDNPKRVAIVTDFGKVKTFYPFHYDKGHFHSKITKTEAYYDRDDKYYVYRIFPRD